MFIYVCHSGKTGLQKFCYVSLNFSSQSNK